MSDGDVLPSPKRSKSPISAAEPSSSEKRPDVSESGSEGEPGSEPVKVTKKQHEKMRSLELYAAANAASERVQKMLERMSSSNCDDADECSAPEVVEMERGGRKEAEAAMTAASPISPGAKEENGKSDPIPIVVSVGQPVPHVHRKSDSVSSSARSSASHGVFGTEMLNEESSPRFPHSSPSPPRSPILSRIGKFFR